MSEPTTSSGDGTGALDRHESDSTRVVDLHEPIYREKSEPKDGYEPTPMWLLFGCLALMGFGGWYLGMFSGGFSGQVYDERAGFTVAAGAAEAPAQAVDPMVLGRRVFNNCMACHQADGEGVTQTYPPLNGSELVLGRPDLPAQIVLHGLEGPIEVRGSTYDNVMPGWSRLGDDEIAAVLTYIRASWDNRAPAVSTELVAAVRASGADRTGAWTAAELEAHAAANEPPVPAGTGEGEGEETT